MSFTCKYCGEGRPTCWDGEIEPPPDGGVMDHKDCCCDCFEIFELKLGLEPFRRGGYSEAVRKASLAHARGYPLPEDWPTPA